MAEARQYAAFPAAALSRWLVGLSLLCLLLFALPAPAMAGDAIRDYSYGFDASSNVTSGIGDLEFGDFSCNADGSTSGTLFINPQCQSPGLIGVFANVVCRVENLFGTILGLIYCAVSNAIVPPLIALFSLYVITYGALLLLGMVPQTFTEGITRIFKIALVSAIAMNADIAIGVGYKFYIGATQTAVGVVFEVFERPETYQTPSSEEMIAAGYMRGPGSDSYQQSGSHWLNNIDNTLHRIFGIFVDGSVGIIMVMLTLLFLMFPLFIMVIYLVLSIFKAFMQAIIGYLLALLGITILFALAPIFVSLALFQSTKTAFEAWLKELAGYTIQMVIVFTFFMLMLMIDLVTFLQNIGSLFRNYPTILSMGPIHIPLTLYSMCKVERTTANEIVYYKFDATGELNVSGGTQYDGFPRCIPEYSLADIDSSFPRTVPLRPLADPTQRPPLAIDDDQKSIIEDMVGRIESDPASEVPHEQQILDAEPIIFEIINDANQQLVLTVFEFMGQMDLIFFLLVRFIVVIILTILMDRFMKQVPVMAETLSGAKFAGRLGGGDSPPGRAQAGIQDSVNFAGVDTGFERFKNAAFNPADFKGGYIRSASARFAKGIAAAAGGMGSAMMQKSLATGGSLGLRPEVRQQLGHQPDHFREQRRGRFLDGQSAAAHSGGRGGSGRSGLHNKGTVRRNTMWSGR